MPRSPKSVGRSHERTPRCILHRQRSRPLRPYQRAQPDEGQRMAGQRDLDGPGRSMSRTCGSTGRGRQTTQVPPKARSDQGKGNSRSPYPSPTRRPQINERNIDSEAAHFALLKELSPTRGSAWLANEIWTGRGGACVEHVDRRAAAGRLPRRHPRPEAIRERQLPITIPIPNEEITDK